MAAESKTSLSKFCSAAGRESPACWVTWPEISTPKTDFILLPSPSVKYNRTRSKRKYFCTPFKISSKPSFNRREDAKMVDKSLSAVETFKRWFLAWSISVLRKLWEISCPKALINSFSSGVKPRFLRKRSRRNTPTFSCIKLCTSPDFNSTLGRCHFTNT